MTNAHPHAALMLQYAQDAAETMTPWARWEYLAPDLKTGWLPCNSHPEWKARTTYRRKPQIIRVNGFEVPAPVKEEKEHQLLWAADPTHPAWAFSLTYRSADPTYVRHFDRGLLHTTGEDAVAHAKAMLGINPKGE